MVRPCSGWVGRTLFGKMSLKAFTWAAETFTGVLSTIQLTPSEQGGVVSEPA